MPWYNDLRGQLNEHDSIEVIKQSLDSGINFFDTADFIPAVKAR
jgi:aryl-alcohol dehydrogenase-like predicted oxidoreductase